MCAVKVSGGGARARAGGSGEIHVPARIARDLASVHSANRWAAVWSPCPHGQAGDTIPGTAHRNRKARRPIFSVRVWHSTAASAFANDSYRRRSLPWKALRIRMLSARAGVAQVHILHFVGMEICLLVRLLLLFL